MIYYVERKDCQGGEHVYGYTNDVEEAKTFCETMEKHTKPCKPCNQKDSYHYYLMERLDPRYLKEVQNEAIS